MQIPRHLNASSNVLVFEWVWPSNAPTSTNTPRSATGCLKKRCIRNMSSPSCMHPSYRWLRSIHTQPLQPGSRIVK